MTATPRVSDRLLPVEIQAGLKTKFFGRPTLMFESLDSTNEFALKLIQPRQGMLVLAEGQTKGRGRFGRPWLAKPYSAGDLASKLRRLLDR